MTELDPLVQAARRGQLAGLPRRIYLTWRYQGPGQLARRAMAFPLRFTPFALRLRLGRATLERRARAKDWFSAHGRPVTVVIPSYGGAAEVRRAVRSIRRTTPAQLVRIVVSDDAGPADQLEQLRQIEGIELVVGERNGGFARSANRGLERGGNDTDVVLVNPDVTAKKGWLECLQYAAYAEGPDVGIVGARLLYPGGQIQHAGLYRNLFAPEWFDHYYRMEALDYGLADVPSPVLAVTGACMYVKHELIDQIGTLDPSYPMAFEDVDWCLRAWQAGYSVVYEPGAILEHVESTSRGREPGERELASQQEFWRRWRGFFEARPVSGADGRLRIAYVTGGTDVGGGHRVVFEDINHLHSRGHDVSLYTLGPAPDWFDLEAPIHSFPDYESLARALAPLDAIKVASWWRTAPHVWRASVLRGIPVYFVQDIETSYYPDGEARRHEVLASYRHEFRYLTTSKWNRDQLAKLGHKSALVPAAVDLNTFTPLDRPRDQNTMLAIARENPLKRFDLTLAAWAALPPTRPELRLFGVEPQLAPLGSRFVNAPTDTTVNELYNECTVFVQTSSHEGFALPPLEAMAAGAAVVCTDADGNRDYCVDGVNCLMPEPEPEAIAAAIQRVLNDPGLRESLGRAGIETAARYDLGRRADAIESFMKGVATGAPRPVGPRE